MKRILYILIIGCFFQCQSNYEQNEELQQCGKIVSFVEYQSTHKITIELNNGNRTTIQRDDIEPKIGDVICF